MPAFGKKAAPLSEGGRTAIDEARLASMRQALQAARKENPHVVPQVAAKELKAKLFEMIKTDRGIHAETAVAILGSLAGYACLLQAFDLRAKGMVKDPRADFLEVGTRDGQRFYFGNLVNRPLMEGQLSVWSLVAGMAQHLGASRLPDLDDIAGHVARTVGSQEFGRPRLPPNYQLTDLPINYLIRLWPKLVTILTRYTDDPADLPLAIGFCLQEVMRDCKDVLDPGAAATIAMEWAVPMSKIDPTLIEPRASPGN